MAGSEKHLTPKGAKRLLGVARVVGPVVAPYAMRAAWAVREGLDRMRARRLGVPVDDIGSFTGKGAALHARIAGDRTALTGLPDPDEDSSAGRFADEAGRRLDQLSTAVRMAERMPAPRRRATHRSVGGELDELEQRLLLHLRVEG